jgi:hypothetical protein
LALYKANLITYHVGDLLLFSLRKGIMDVLVREFRKALGKTLRQFATDLNMHYTTLGDKERGRRRWTLDNLLQCSRALHVPLSYLYVDVTQPQCPDPVQVCQQCSKIRRTCGHCNCPLQHAIVTVPVCGRCTCTDGDVIKEED